MNQHLNISRIVYLARRDLINRWRGLAITVGAVAGAPIVLVLLQLLFSGGASLDYSSYLKGALIIWGCIDASMAFLALHNKSTNEAFLMLPASALEKTLVRLLFTSLFLPILIFISILVSSLFSELFSVIFVGQAFNPLQIFDAGHLEFIAYVVIAQSVFFLGAAWFRKAHLVKTVFTLIVTSIALGFLGGLLFRIVFASYFQGLFIPKAMDIDMESLMFLRYPGLMKFLAGMGKTIFYGLLAPFCWFVAWLRVKETQSSDGI